MKSGDPAEHKSALLSLRSAVVLTLALLVAIAAGGLLFAAHRSMALAVLGAGGAFAAAVTLFNNMIELQTTMTEVFWQPGTVELAQLLDLWLERAARYSR